MITNRCFENCPHCMENSNPEGQMIDERTFHKAVMFAKYIGSRVVALSGGEPTTHPDFFKFCKALNDDYKMPFTVVSNGTWALPHFGSLDWEGTSENLILQYHLDNEKVVRQIRRMCSDFKNFVGMQVYTNKLFYKDYEKIHSKKSFFDSFGGKVILDESPIRSMKDLGRARVDELSQKMVDESKYYMSCLNSVLVGMQVFYPREYGLTLEKQALHFCHPMVDFKGDVHLSESWMCQSVGNVTRDQFGEIWGNITNYEPCGKCKGYKKFMASKDPKVVMARKIMKVEN